MPPTVLALAACGTVVRRDSLICAPVKVLLISLRPAIEWSAIELPVIVAAAYAVPLTATASARLATIKAGDGRRFLSMGVLRSRLTAPSARSGYGDPRRAVRAAYARKS